MTSSVSMTNLVFSGTAAAAQNAIYKIMSLYSTMSSQYDKLMILDTVSSFKSAESTAENTKNASHEQASQTRDQAYGEFACGVVSLGGMGVGFAYSTLAEKGLDPREEELQTVKDYQTETENALKQNVGKNLSNSEKGEDLETKRIKNTLGELSRTSDFSKRIPEKEKQALKLSEEPQLKVAKADKDALYLGDEDQLKEISKHLNKRGQSLEEEINGSKSRISKNADHIMQASNAVGQIGRASAQIKAANHQEDAGKFESEKVMSETGGKLMDQLYQQSAQNASKYLDLSLQLPEILTGLQQADSSQT